MERFDGRVAPVSGATSGYTPGPMLHVDGGFAVRSF